MIKINRSPVLTSKSYGVNFFEIDDTALNFENSDIVSVQVKNNNYKESFTKNNVPQISMSTELNEQLKNNNNFSKVFKFDKDSFKPLEIDFTNNKTLIGVIDLSVNDNIRASCIIKINSNIKAYNNFVTTIKLCKDACLDLSVICDTQCNSNNFLSIIGNCETNSQLNLNIIDFGCANSVQNVNVNLNDFMSRTNINSIYFGGLNEKLGLNYLVSEFGKKCKCSINAIGVLSNNAYKNFLGTIDFKKGAQQSDGSENEHCILLSNDVKAYSTPILLSKEEDVNGSHSSSVGKIDDDELFYLMTRGISKNEATKLLVKAKLVKLVNNLQDENLKLEIFKRIDEKIDEQN